MAVQALMTTGKADAAARPTDKGGKRQAARPSGETAAQESVQKTMAARAAERKDAHPTFAAVFAAKTKTYVNRDAEVSAARKAEQPAAKNPRSVGFKRSEQNSFAGSAVAPQDAQCGRATAKPTAAGPKSQGIAQVTRDAAGGQGGGQAVPTGQAESPRKPVTAPSVRAAPSAEKKPQTIVAKDVTSDSDAAKTVLVRTSPAPGLAALAAQDARVRGRRFGADSPKALEGSPKGAVVSDRQSAGASDRLSAAKAPALATVRVSRSVQAAQTRESGSAQTSGAKGGAVPLAPGVTVEQASVAGIGQAGGPQATGEKSAGQAADAAVTDQIAESIRSSSVKVDRQIVIQLSPPELGKVRVTLRSSGNRLRGVMEVDNPDTLRRLEREATVLTQRLQESGVQVRRMDVVMVRQDGGPASENPLTRDGDRRRSGGEPADVSAAAGSGPPPAAAETAEADAAAAGGPEGVGAINVRI
jgi:flagellar hook-length control protein FliK